MNTTPAAQPIYQQHDQVTFHAQGDIRIGRLVQWGLDGEGGVFYRAEAELPAGITPCTVRERDIIRKVGEMKPV